MHRFPMATERPLLFVDVDGVLNVLGWRGPDYENLRVAVGGTPCIVPPGTRARMERLLAVYDPVWATAWLGRAHSAWHEVLDLHTTPWPYVSYVGLKLPEIIRYATGRRWAWIDDDAYWELQQLGWTADHVEGYIPFVDGRDGLTDELVDSLLEYAEQTTSRR